jgi:hypothetical protein
VSPRSSPLDPGLPAGGAVTTADGRTAEFTGSIGYDAPPEVGSAVPVRYRSDDPEQAEIDRALLIWLLPAIAGSVVVGLFVAAVLA